MSACERLEIHLYSSPFRKLKYKWIKDTNMKPDILNLVEENVRKNLVALIQETIS